MIVVLWELLCSQYFILVNVVGFMLLYIDGDVVSFYCMPPWELHVWE